jgi:hypothetical protein
MLFSHRCMSFSLVLPVMVIAFYTFPNCQMRLPTALRANSVDGSANSSSILTNWRSVLLGGVVGVSLTLASITIPTYIEYRNTLDTQETEITSIAAPVVLFQNILSDLEKDYIDKIDPVKLFKTGIQAMLQSLDPYTEFEDLRVAQTMKESVSGKYGGVGLVIGNTNGRVQPVEDSQKKKLNPLQEAPAPMDGAGRRTGGGEGGAAGGGGVVVLDAFEGYAYDSDLRPGDVLLSIDGVDCTTGGVEGVRDLLRGDPDTEVSRLDAYRSHCKMRIYELLLRQATHTLNFIVHC